MIRILTQSLKIASIAAVALIVVAGSAAFFTYWTDRQQADDLGQAVTIEVTEDDTAGSVSDKLADAGLIRFGWYFETRYRLSGSDLAPGTYTIRKGMSVNDILNVVTAADDGQAASADEPAPASGESAASIEVTLIEGNRVEEDADAIVTAGWQGDRQAFIDAVRDPSRFSDYPFLADLPEGATLEGFLFPNTYTFAADAPPEDIINVLLAQFDAEFNDEMQQQASDADLTIFEVTTLGSIVEREVQVPEERPIVAALYQNRLDQGMQLQTDPTLQYAVGTEGNWWPELNTDLIAQASGNPYNTYEISGLPPGPIASPGIAALQAVLQPAEVDYVYMVARSDGSGTHLFTSDLNQHEQNICAERPESEICGGNHLPGGNGRENARIDEPRSGILPPRNIPR